ncbi:unnamed protein product [Closterium sp. Naga37s-1]|nr:unnamed protein product [Closterium sp. Naga37s-1]
MPASAVTGGAAAGGSRQMSMGAFVTPRVHGQQLREGLVQLFAAADLPFRLVECREVSDAVLLSLFILLLRIDMVLSAPHPIPPSLLLIPSHHLCSSSHATISAPHPIPPSLLLIPSHHLCSSSHPTISAPHPIPPSLLLIPSHHLCSSSHPTISAPHPDIHTTIYAFVFASTAYGEAAREDMRQLLVGDGLAGRMSLTFDIWTGENNVAFMAVTCHYVTSDFQLKPAVIDFRELKGSHTGDLIADELEEVLREWGLEKMLFAVTCDNAENNSRAMRLLAGVPDARPGSRPRHPPLLSRWRHFRCVAHVVNLAVQAALKVDEVAEPLKRLRDVANYIGWSTLRTDRFFELQRGYAATRPQGPPCSRRASGPLRLIVDSPTRWGSTLNMVNRGFKMRMPIAMFFDDSDPSISKETRKAWDAIRLTDAHWDDLAELRDFLTPFEQVTPFAEGSLYPTLSAVVPQYNVLIDLQEKAQLTPGISPLRSSLITAALGKLERHMGGVSEEAAIATFLDPCQKLAPFKHRARAAEGNSRGATLELGPDRVKALVRARLSEYQAASTTAQGDGGEVTSARGAGVHASAGGGAVDASAKVSIQSQLFAAWDAMEAEEGEDPQDEVDQYLAEGRQRGGSALEYWHSRETLKGLRAMARDYLGVPASSAASERAFSQSRNIITWQRHRLAAGQLRASMLIKTWQDHHPLGTLAPKGTSSKILPLDRPNSRLLGLFCKKPDMMSLSRRLLGQHVEPTSRLLSLMSNDTWPQRMASLLEERSLSVLLATMSLLVALVAANPEAYLCCVPKCVKVLERLAKCVDIPQDYTYAIPSPWLQVRHPLALAAGTPSPRPGCSRPLEPHSLHPCLPPYLSQPTMVPVQSFTGGLLGTGGAAGHRWGCWSQVGLLVTGGAAGHRWGCWSQVGLLVTGGAAGHRWGCWSQVGLLVLVLAAGAGAGSWCWQLALGLVPDAGGWRWGWFLVLAAGAGAGSWCWRLALGLVPGAGGRRWGWFLVLATGAGAGSWCWRLALGLVPGAGGWRWGWFLVLAAGAGAGSWCWRLALGLVPGAGGWRWCWFLVLAAGAATAGATGEVQGGAGCSRWRKRDRGPLATSLATSLAGRWRRVRWRSP